MPHNDEITFTIRQYDVFEKLFNTYPENVGIYAFLDILIEAGFDHDLAHELAYEWVRINITG